LTTQTTPPSSPCARAGRFTRPINTVSTVHFGIHGGFCYAKEYYIERLWREARLLKIAPVSQEMVLNFISQKILGLPKSY